MGVPEQSIQAEAMSRLDGKPRNVVPGFREGGEETQQTLYRMTLAQPGNRHIDPEIRRDGERLNQKRR